MKEIAKYDNWFKFLSISVIVIVVCVFTLTVSNTHLAKGTYATETGTSNTDSCAKGYYLRGTSCVRCPTGYTSSEGAATKQTDCYIECDEDTYIAYPGAYSCTACGTGKSKVAHNVNYGSTSNCSGTSTPTPNKECANKTIIFSYSQGGDGISCTTDENGKLSDSSCIARAEALCSYYSALPGQSCYGSGGVKEKISPNYYRNNQVCDDIILYCIEGYSHGCNCGTNCGGETPTNPPSKSSEPSKSSSPSKDNTSCFECNGEYVWTNNPGSNCKEITSITSEDKCVKTSCYKCVKTNATEYLYATSESNAKSITDANSCSKTDDKYCKENIIVNPPTGTAGIIVAWLVGLSAIVYSFWYFKKNSAMK